jgi:uncharacterized protein
MPQPSPVAVWFEIPVQNFERAATFYETLLGVTLKREAMGDMTLGVFPHDGETASGCIMAGPGVAPAAGGAIIYLNAEGVFDQALETAWSAGGAILTPATELPDGLGRFAHVRDTEGNRVGLHAA